MELPREESLRWMVSRYAGLHARHGAGIGRPELVQPTGRYFPDAFSPTGEGVARLVARFLEYAPLREGLDVKLRFVDEDGEPTAGGSCGTGGCGTGGCSTEAKSGPGDKVLELDDGYLLELPAASIGNAVALTSTLARSVGTMVLVEAGEATTAAELGGLSELAAVASGFGVLLLSGAYVYGKSCGGARVSRHTHLSVEELAVAVALFTRLHGLKPQAATSHLEVTQREALGEADDWVQSNPSLVTQLRTRPEILEAGMFRIEERKGFLGKLLARRAAAEEEATFAFSPRRMNG